MEIEKSNFGNIGLGVITGIFFILTIIFFILFGINERNNSNRGRSEHYLCRNIRCPGTRKPAVRRNKKGECERSNVL